MKTTIPGQIDEYFGYAEDIAFDFISCICTSETFFHLRWGYYDDDPQEDDNKTICQRRRGPDKEGFWLSASSHCGDCVSEMHDAASAIGKDMGWLGYS